MNREMQDLTIRHLETMLRRLQTGELEVRSYTSRHGAPRATPNGMMEVTLHLYDPDHDKTKDQPVQKEMHLL